MTSMSLVDLGGFMTTAAGSVLGILLDLSLGGTASILVASAAGGVIGSAVGWMALRRTRHTGCHTA